jgi:hypothetical protein
MKTYTQAQAISLEEADRERRWRDFKYVCSTSNLPCNNTLLHSQRKAEKKAQRTAEQKRRRAEEAAARRAIQNKRDQWKAASARYYERHPEVKEKKRLKAAEKRCVIKPTLLQTSHNIHLVVSAAKRLARRRWDPPSVGERCRYYIPVLEYTLADPTLADGSNSLATSSARTNWTSISTLSSTLTCP